MVRGRVSIFSDLTEEHKNEYSFSRQCRMMMTLLSVLVQDSIEQKIFTRQSISRYGLDKCKGKMKGW